MAEQVSPIEFGKVVGMLGGIKNDIAQLRTEVGQDNDRLVWRLDDIERRVEVVENTHSRHKPFWNILMTICSALIGAAIVWVAK